MAEKLALAEGTFDGCFGCGPANPVGLRLSFHREGNEVVAWAVLGRQYAGYKDFVHGGIVATMLDEAMGWALFHLGGVYGVTRSLAVNYRRPVLVGRRVAVRSSIVERDGNTLRVESRLVDERGRLLASAEGLWATVRDERAKGG
ncbi:MAG: PaaI family thioesterase [Candidatus Dadabacteria bacterium]|nr:MAG: PaaI family thioesterase [Candidatus Dadabacteria bacterium]